jgi:site-specific recombinase XerD
MGGHYLRDPVLVALYGGLREVEIFNLKKIVIKLKERYLLVTESKTHENRIAPMNGTLVDIMRRWLAESLCEYVL